MKQCPFCGCREVFIAPVNVPEEVEWDYYYVHCTKCEANGPLMGTAVLAASMWNTRGEAGGISPSETFRAVETK